MHKDKMLSFDLISKGFAEYLEKRTAILGALADISIAKPQKSVSLEISALLNRIYRNVSEEFSVFMQN